MSGGQICGRWWFVEQWMFLIRRRVTVADTFMPYNPTLILHTKGYLKLSARAAECQSDVRS